jgi:hypothetical protein
MRKVIGQTAGRLRAGSGGGGVVAVLLQRPMLLVGFIICCFLLLRVRVFSEDQSSGGTSSPTHKEVRRIAMDGDSSEKRGASQSSSSSGGAGAADGGGGSLPSMIKRNLVVPFRIIPPSRLPPAVSADIPVRDHTSEIKHILVVVGIPTTDTPFGANRRQWQRTSWLSYKNVWKPLALQEDTAEDVCSERGSRGGGCVLVKYLIGRHPTHSHRFSPALLDEVNTFHGDVIGFNMKEGVPSTGKKSGGAGYWGLEAEVGMSRKALLWYRVSLELYPQAQYIMKSDDDVFLRIPQYVHDLQALHKMVEHQGGGKGDAPLLYWGKVMKWGAIKGDPKSKFYFVGGMSVTLSRALAHRITQYAPIQEHALVDFPTNIAPQDASRMYKAHNMDHEDVMLGRIVYNEKWNVTLIKDCRYHDVHTGANVQPITDRSLAIHHLKESEYRQLFLRFGEDKVEDTVWRPTSARPFHVAFTPC